MREGYVLEKIKINYNQGWIANLFFEPYSINMIVYSIITKEKKWFIATAVPSGVVSQGKTIEEAKDNLQEALELYYEDKLFEEKDQPLIAPVEINVKTRA